MQKFLFMQGISLQAQDSTCVTDFSIQNRF